MHLLPHRRPGSAAPKVRLPVFLRMQPPKPTGPMNAGWGGVGNSGPMPMMYRRVAAAAPLANATGIRLRGFHSNSSNSTERSTAARGEAKVADMPPAAPATRRVLRSALVRWKSWAMSEPNAPPVIMIGPWAPKGPPDPIEMADDTGFRMATLGWIRPPLSRIASIASGMP